MAKQDDYIRITLRLPPELHRDLVALAGVKSMNAYIVESLDEMARITKSRLQGADDENKWLEENEPASVNDLERDQEIEKILVKALRDAGIKLVHKNRNS